jgi:hypothetical protein
MEAFSCHANFWCANITILLDDPWSVMLYNILIWWKHKLMDRKHFFTVAWELFYVTWPMEIFMFYFGINFPLLWEQSATFVVTKVVTISNKFLWCEWIAPNQSIPRSHHQGQCITKRRHIRRSPLLKLSYGRSHAFVSQRQWWSLGWFTGGNRLRGQKG